MDLKKRLKQLAASTCLTAATLGTAGATTIIESTDFGNSFAQRTVLPLGTTVVQGQLDPNGGDIYSDYFSFVSLVPNLQFTVTWLETGGGPKNFFVLTNSEIVLTTAFGSNSGSFTGTVPGDGILVLGVTLSETGGYQVSLNAATVPEPLPTAMVGLGLALGAAALKKKR